jgi:translation initiation factor 4B
LPDLPGRGSNDRRVSDRGFGSGRTFGDAGSEAGDRRDRRDPFPQDDGKVRDFGNWERRGPLSPLPQQERQAMSREGGRSSTNDGARPEGFRDRRASPAAWGEGRAQGSQDGSRPPRREFHERPVAERTPTAAEQDNQWRAKMKPDALATKSPVTSREGSEAPTSPALTSASTVPASRPKLHLAKRTVTEADKSSLAPGSGDAKASPFGAARPIDTAAKEKEIEEKRLAALKEKKEADEKIREENRLAKNAPKADKPATDSGEITESASAEGSETVKASEKEDQNSSSNDSAGPKDSNRDARLKPADTGAWRRPSGGSKPPRNDAPRGPRGDAVPRGPRHDAPRAPPRANGSGPVSGNQPVQSPVESEALVPEEDGWSTVSKPKKNQRGGFRAVPS